MPHALLLKYPGTNCDVETERALAAAMQGCPCARVGHATADGKLTLTSAGKPALVADIADLKHIWKHGLTPYY